MRGNGQPPARLRRRHADGHACRPDCHKTRQGHDRLDRADQDKVDIINVLIKYGYQDLADFGISFAMQDEYDRLIARARAIQPEP